MLDLENTHPLEEFRQNTSAHLDRLKETGEPEILTVNGQPEVVVQSANAYQKLLDEVEDLRSIRIIRQSLAEAKRGEGRPARQVLQEIADKHGIELPK